MDITAALVFWLSVLLLAFGYAGYPALIYGLGRRHRQPNQSNEIWPNVSLLVPAYNEARMIRRKIDNCTQLEYPPDRLEILVASDGSTDATADVVEQATKAGEIRGVVYPERRGKAAVINDLVALSSGDIVVLSDATTMLTRGSLRALVSNFADARVGCVSGLYRIVVSGRDGKAKPEALYWRYETLLRQAEARLGRMLGAHGALYAFRRKLFEPLEPWTRNEDFIIPVTILMKGYRSVYDARAIASEDAQEMTGFARRISLQAGNYQQIGLLLKRRGWLRQPLLVFQIVSHKGLRLLTPFLMLAAYASNAWLLASPAYRLLFAAQTLFFTAALVGSSARVRRWARAFVAAPYYFCMVNAAGVIALHRIVWRKGPLLTLATAPHRPVEGADRRAEQTGAA